jgi:hypothetical protein
MLTRRLPERVSTQRSGRRPGGLVIPRLRGPGHPWSLLIPGLALAASVSCADDFDTTRTIPKRGSLGTELFGVVCDRVGGQALHEDPTGASFHAVCHPDTSGSFADHVDQTLLPPMVDGQLDINGTAVPLAKQQADRAYGVARVETLGRHRAALVAALDATFPDIQVPIKDLSNPDPTRSCAAPAASGEGSLHTELSNLLGRFEDLYTDGTIPQSTESLARVVNAFKASPEAQAAWAVFDARAGYRPIDIALGTPRPVVAYPKLRDFTNATLKLLSFDSDPYALHPQVDAQGNRIPVPGAAYPQLTKMLEVAHAELLNATADPAEAPLKVVADPITGRTVLSRPRGDLEVLQSLLYAQDPAYGGGASRYIAQRDPRGFVLVARPNGVLPPPFVDADGDGLADVNMLGQFVTSNALPSPSPFFAVDAPAAVARDSYTRALDAPKGNLLFDYIDTSHTYTASFVRHLGALVDPVPADNHETLMDALAGTRVLFGPRDGSPATPKTYADGTVVHYDAFHVDSSPVLDLLYALGQIMADPTTDDTLTFAETLVSDHPNDVARLVGDGLYARKLAIADTVAKLPATSTLWDELIDNTVQIAQEPGLLEDVLRAFGDDATLQLATALGGYMANKDHISYDRNNLNGHPFNFDTNDDSDPKTPVDRTTPDSGANRSEFQRFVQSVHDTLGVTACNKEGAVIHTQGVSISLPVIPVQIPLNPDICNGSFLGSHGEPCVIPGSHPFGECEVFKIDNLAAFYLDSMVGLANLYFRPDVLRNGFLGTGASTISIIEQSSAIGWDPSNVDAYNGPDLTQPGFWDTMTGMNAAPKTFRPKPAWLNRQVFFDLANDSPTPSGKNYLTNHFLTDLQGPQFPGTAACPERVIPDPCANNSAQCGDLGPSGANVAADGMIHGLRACADGDWFPQRDQDATFIWEDLGFFNAINPLARAFVTAQNPTTGQARRREDLFLELMDIVNKHWQSAAGTADECKLGVDVAGNPIPCSKDGADSYEPLLSQIFSSDMLTAVHDLVKVIGGISIPTCAKSDPQTHLCTQAGPTIDGISILASSTRALVDPVRAKAAGLVDRRGNATALRNDGTMNPQVTPLYLVLETLNEMDQAFVQYAQANPQDTGRQAQWRRARSQLVDEFLAVNGENTPMQSFADPSLPKILPVLIDAARAQLTAHCPPPYTSCTWASHDLWTNSATTIGGPTFAASMDLQEKTRQDVPARTETEKLLAYLANAASSNEALAELLTSADDVIQVMRDDARLVPLYHVLATAALPTQTDAQGNVQRGALDANSAMLARIAGRAFDTAGNEICARELDPNAVLNVALAHLVTPMPGSGAPGTPTLGETPLEVILDAIADVNRASPGSPAKLDGPDYANASNEISEFLLDPQRGLEQFYEIVRQGIVH